MKTSTKTKLIDPLLIFIAGSSYGFIVPVIKAATGIGILPHAFLPLQYVVAFIAGFSICLIRRVHCPNVKTLCKMAFLGICTGLTSICYYTSVSLLPSALALTLLFQYVWVSVLIECVVERHLPCRSTIIAIVIVLIGTCFASGLIDRSVEHFNWQELAFGIASAFFYALYLYLSGRIATDQPTALRTTLLAIGGIVITSLANPAVYATSFFDANIWPYAIGLSILGILLPTTLINYASPKLSPGMVSIMASSELPIGIFAAWAFVSDAPSMPVLFGAFLVLFGIVVKSWPTLIHSHKPSQNE